MGRAGAVNKRPEDERMRRAKNHLCCNPHDAEVTLGPLLFYHLLAHRQRRLPRPRRGPPAVSLLARPGLPLLAGIVPQGLRPRLPPQGPPPLRQDRPAPAPPPPAGHRPGLLRPPFLR